MRYSYFLLILLLTAGCSHPQPVGKRVTLAKGNISFILLDSSLVYSKPVLWPGDYKLSDYGEAGGFYHNQDSSVIVSIYVKAYPDTAHRALLWRVLANEKRQREDFLAKNRGFAIIENFAADSSTRTVRIDYHTVKRSEKGWRGQASYERSFTFYGPQRTINFWFFGPDNAPNRQAIAAACASVHVNPTYLQAGAKPYPAGEYRD
jgi:hypothetical protein